MTTVHHRYTQKETPEQKRLREDYEAAKLDYYSTASYAEAAYREMMRKYNAWMDEIFRGQQEEAK